MFSSKDEDREDKAGKKEDEEPKENSNPEEKKKSEVDEEVYNPFEHRDVKKPMSDWGALAHMLKTSLGSGILAMPMAFKNSGLIGGFFGTVTLGIVCIHCIYMLVNSAQKLCVRNRVPKLTFSETAEKAFENGPPSAKKSAKAMGITVIVQLLASFTLGNSVYVVFISASLQQVITYTTNFHMNIRYYILILWLPLTIMCMARNLKTLVPFSIIANILVLFSFGTVLYYIFREIDSPHHAYLVSPLKRWPMFLTTILFALEGIGTVMAIENEMKNPSHFVKGRFPVAIIAMTIVVTTYSVVGFLGYLTYGDSTEGCVTLNLPVQEMLARSVEIVIATAIFFTYALQFYVPIKLTCGMIKSRLKPKYHLLTDILVRVGFVTLTIITAIAIPNLEPIIALVGAICFSVLGLTMPSLIDIMTRYPDFGWWKWRLIKNIIIITISLFCLVAGTYTSILEMHLKSYVKND